MTTNDLAWVSDACSLPTVERPLRLNEFDDLFATAVRGVEQVTPTHARLYLAGGAGLTATVQDLAARETQCCSFFDVTVTPEADADGETVILDVTVPAQYTNVLGALARRASTVAAGQKAMTGVLLDLAERAEVPVDRLRHYAEVGLLRPARHDGDRLGYPASEAHTMRLLAMVEGLGIAADDLPALARSWRDGDCGQAQRQLADAVTTRLDAVQSRIADQQRRATRDGPGTPGWVQATQATVALAADAARLQAIAAALPATPHAGPCDEDCDCMTALTTPGEVYQFPTAAATSEPALACDLAADDGDASNRIGVWQQVFTRVQRRDPLDDTPAGLALHFPMEADLAATLARLAAAEYRCCSFGSYTIVIDHTGLRLEIRMPHDATGLLAAVVGIPDTLGTPSKEADRATDQP